MCFRQEGTTINFGPAWLAMQSIRTKCRDSKNLPYVTLLGEKKNCFTLPWYPVPGYLSFAGFGERNLRVSDDRHFPPGLEEG